MQGKISRFGNYIQVVIHNSFKQVTMLVHRIIARLVSLRRPLVVTKLEGSLELQPAGILFAMSVSKAKLWASQRWCSAPSSSPPKTPALQITTESKHTNSSIVGSLNAWPYMNQSFQ
jgi:hypothetical protein